MSAPKTRVERRAAARGTAKGRKAWLPWVGLAVVVAVALFALSHLGQRASTALSETGTPTVGNPGAPLHAYLFEDYQCPICRHYEMDGGADQFAAKWVASGKVLVVYKHLTFLDPRSPGGRDSTNGAEASLCAYRLNATAWPSWNHLVFQDQGPEGSGWATPAYLRGLTQQWGHASMAAYDPCMAGSTGFHPDSVIAQSKRDGDAVGVTGTPTLVVRGQPVSALDAAAVDAAIQAALGS